MGMIGEDSDDEYERELKLAVQRYKNNQKPERKKDGERNEVIQVKKKWPKEPKEKCKVLKEYENQGALPKAIYNKIKGNETLFRDCSDDRKSRRGRNSFQLLDPKRQFNGKSATGENNSGLDRNLPNGNTCNKKVKVNENFWKSFYYLVPEEPSPDFFLPPGCYYVVSKDIDLTIQTVVVCHPERSKKDSPKDGSKAGKGNRKHVEHYTVPPKNVNDVNKSERNCSNAALVRNLISDYNSGKYKGDILSKIQTIKSDLEAEIEAFKSALTESTMALDQLITLKFSLNYKMSSDKKLNNKIINIKEDSKGTESCEENDAEVNSATENCLVNEEGGEGGLGVENPPTNEEVTPAQEERTEEDTVLSETQDADKPAEGYSGEHVQKDEMTKKISEITSLLPDISDTYLRTELEKMGDDVNSIEIFLDNLFVHQNYPKIQVDPDEEKRKRLWKEHVTDFNPKKFLFELSIVSLEGAAKNANNDNDDINLVLSFLRRRYPKEPLTELTHAYEISKNVAEVCKSYDAVVVPVRLSESGFWEEKFDKEFLLKVTYLDHEEEIDDYLSGIQEKRKLEREEAKLLNAFLQCITCLNDIVPSETITCSEGHVFCSNCVEMYIRVELGKGNYKFKCFSGDCDGFFDQKTLEELLPASVLLKISMKQQAEEIREAKVEGLESCSFCDFAYIPDPNDKIFWCQNPACMAEICRICHEINHIPLRCTEVERPKDVEARKKIEEVMTKTLVRYCPSCQKKIVKIDGCNKMTCVCGTLFCYLCQQKIYDYSHFGPICPLRSDDIELHVKRVVEAGIQARDELLTEDQGIKIVQDPTEYV